MSEPAPDAVAVPRRRFAWVRAASDRVPTRWFAAIGTGLFLAVTAAFGGLATAAEPEVPVAETDQAIVAAPFTVTVERAVLLDEFPEAGVYVEDGERVLALQLEVVNDWTEPLAAGSEDSLADTVRVEGLDVAASAAHYDDATINPRLQPGVPTTVVLTWAVDADRFAEGDEIEVAVNSMTLYTAGYVASGRWWTDPVATATVAVPLTDAGAGAGE
ncbi:MAG: hypothetical protein ABW024_09340 [Microbacterium sp.]